MDLLGVGLRRAREGFDGWLERVSEGDTACAGRVRTIVVWRGGVE
jgi:hypothetical protein